MVLGDSNLQEKLGLKLVMVMCITFSVFTRAYASVEGDVQHFKMISNVEYTGKGQFRNQAEKLFTVRKSPLSEDQVLFLLSERNINVPEEGIEAGKLSVPKEFSFALNTKTRHLSGGESDLMFLGKVNNACVKSLKTVTNESVGQTWEQSFDLSDVDDTLPKELKFTLTAEQLKSDLQGELIAVRAVSEPFDFFTVKSDWKVGSVRCKVGSVYLFDKEVENIYVSISVFNATTNANGYKENLRHEVATYKTDAEGEPVNLSGLDKSFEKIVQKLGLREKSLEVKEATILPNWARSKGFYTAQVAHICAATACEGAVNPVATVFIPTSQVVKNQGMGTSKTTSATISVGKALARDIPGIASMKIAASPAFLGIGLWESAAIAGGTVAIAAGGSSDSSSSRSSSQ